MQWFGGDQAPQRTRSAARRRRHTGPVLENLEGRQLMTVTSHGGAVLPNVEVQALYYGSDWSNNPTYYSQTGYLEGFLGNIVNSSYMDMLTRAGYGVGRGTQDGGKISLTNVNKSQYLTDGQIRSTIQGYINNGVLKSPNANTLYVFYVEDNVAVSAGGQTSQNNFLGYHWAFAGTDAAGHPADIHYAVITYPGGSVGNASLSWTSALGQLTEVTSHELAEAVTDPNDGYKTLGWYDDSKAGGLGETGDIVNGQTVYLNGYAVQRISDKNDQAMTPAGATAQTQESFVLQTNGNLYKNTGSGLIFLTSGIASVSDQSIDNHGQVMVDVVTTGGYAYEYHEGAGWTYLWSGAKSAKAGEGVSYVLFNNGQVFEYTDATGGSSLIDSNVASIDAGTDKFGVNMEDEVMTYGTAWEHSDSSGWHYLGSGVRSVSAGQQGISDFVTTSGNAYWYNEATGGTSFLSSNVAQVTTGIDRNGNYMVDLLYNGGNLYEYRVGSGWTFLDSGVQSVAKGHAGLVDMVFTWGDAWSHDASGWHYLGGSARTAS
jgi:hypothetical protein